MLSQATKKSTRPKDSTSSKTNVEPEQNKLLTGR